MEGQNTENKIAVAVADYPYIASRANMDQKGLSVQEICK